MTFLDYLPNSPCKGSLWMTLRYLLVKGGSFSECFSLWSFPQENVPNHYPQLFNLGWKVEGSNWLTNKKAFEKCAALCSTALCRLGLLKVKTKSSSPPSSNFKLSFIGKLGLTFAYLCVGFKKKVWKSLKFYFLSF